MVSVIRHLKNPKFKWRFERIYTMTSYGDENDLDWVKWVERYVIGTTHPLKSKLPVQHKKDLDALNRALRYGNIIGKERNFTIASNGNKEIITEYMVYHVGFKHRPDGK